MLKKITTSLKSLGTKSLILVIALSFAVWGIGDIFTGGSNPTVATVGNSKIELKQFNLEYQGILDKLRQGTDEPITDEFVKAMGLQNTVLNNMINQKYINILSKDLGIIVSDKYIKKSIIKNQMFHDQLGVFNKDYFNYFLNRNNISEKQLVNINRDGLINDILIKSLSFSENIPKAFSENIIKKRDLVRKADIYEVNTASKIINNKITQKDLEKKYNQIKSTLLTPEKRNVSIIYIDDKDIEELPSLTENDILNVYKKNIAEYLEPEKRSTLQIIFDNKKDADGFVKKTLNKKNFFDYLKANNIRQEDISLGNIIKGQLDEETESIIFALKKEEVSAPLKTSFGWKVLFLEDIIQEKKVPFSQVKEKIKSTYLNDLINEKIYEKADIFYESFLENKNLKKSLKYANLSKVSYKELSVDDIKKLYKNKKIKIEEDTLIKIIFNLGEKNISDPLENSQNSLFYIHIDEIKKPKQKELKDAKKQVLEAIYKELKQNLAFNISKDLLYNLNNNKDSDKELYTLQKTNWVTSDNRLGSDINSKVKNIIFTTPINKFSQITQIEDFRYVIVKPFAQKSNALKPDKKTNLKLLNQEIDQSIDNDILNAFLQEMKLDTKSSVNQNFLNSF